MMLNPQDGKQSKFLQRTTISLQVPQSIIAPLNKKSIALLLEKENNHHHSLRQWDMAIE